MSPDSSTSFASALLGTVTQLSSLTHIPQDWLWQWNHGLQHVSLTASEEQKEWAVPRLQLGAAEDGPETDRQGPSSTGLNSRQESELEPSTWHHGLRSRKQSHLWNMAPSNMGQKINFSQNSSSSTLWKPSLHKISTRNHLHKCYSFCLRSNGCRNMILLKLLLGGV